ncbi:hypothetical protein PoB_006577800 [Plakobranchus ocellatus]|uniref:Uncharacterized protein n=1 Tax=Plakobranchus ocellatus TaxID=259542 RepID=A0AAV4D581_9GAST|nr:hypothetical protein PoB_006577800 [Plakobranchus ocellatus]
MVAVMEVVVVVMIVFMVVVAVLITVVVTVDNNVGDGHEDSGSSGCGVATAGAKRDGASMAPEDVKAVSPPFERRNQTDDVNEFRDPRMRLLSFTINRSVFLGAVYSRTRSDKERAIEIRWARVLRFLDVKNNLKHKISLKSKMNNNTFYCNWGSVVRSGKERRERVVEIYYRKIRSRAVERDEDYINNDNNSNKKDKNDNRNENKTNKTTTTTTTT